MEQIRNVLKRASGGEYDYESLDDGMYLMGMVGLKESTKKNYFTGETTPSYQLTFRCKDNPKAFVNANLPASVHKKSNLFKVLQLMSGGKFKCLPDEPGGDPDEAFGILTKGVGKWFNVMVSKTDKGDGKVFNNISNCSVIPAKDANDEFGDCNEWFKTHQAKAPIEKRGDDLPTGFESFPDKVVADSVVDLTAEEDLEEAPF